MPDWALLLQRKEVSVDDTSSKMHDPTRRADRYRKAAAEYLELADGAPTPFLRAYYQRVAEENTRKTSCGLWSRIALQLVSRRLKSKRPSTFAAGTSPGWFPLRQGRWSNP
jgi:hypothetical protein